MKPRSNTSHKRLVTNAKPVSMPLPRNTDFYRLMAAITECDRIRSRASLAFTAHRDKSDLRAAAHALKRRSKTAFVFTPSRTRVDPRAALRAGECSLRISAHRAARVTRTGAVWVTRVRDVKNWAAPSTSIVGQRVATRRVSARAKHVSHGVEGVWLRSSHRRARTTQLSMAALIARDHQARTSSADEAHQRRKI
jgi:hypothetical protein